MDDSDILMKVKKQATTKLGYFLDQKVYKFGVYYPSRLDIRPLNRTRYKEWLEEDQINEHRPSDISLALKKIPVSCFFTQKGLANKIVDHIFFDFRPYLE